MNCTSKEKFINKLAFLLSFKFDEVECSNIINDYEDWFVNEMANGKEESQLCLELGSPRQVVKNVC